MFCRSCLWVQRIPGPRCWSLAPCPSLSRRKLTAGAGRWFVEGSDMKMRGSYFNVSCVWQVSGYVHVNTHKYKYMYKCTYLINNTKNDDINDYGNNTCVYVSVLTCAPMRAHTSTLEYTQVWNQTGPGIPWYSTTPNLLRWGSNDQRWRFNMLVQQQEWGFHFHEIAWIRLVTL